MTQRPSYTEFCVFCKKCGWDADWYIDALWNRLEDKGWKKKGGKRPKSWQILASAVNGVLMENLRKNGVKLPFTSKKEKRKGINPRFKDWYATPVDCEPYSDLGNRYVCYTDGSCDNLSKQRAGGAAYIVIKDGEIIRMKNHGQLGTTNNRMELLAIISAVNACPDGACVDVYTDSQYCIRLLQKTERPWANEDLFDLYKKCSSHVEGVRFHWVKGHDGDKYNEMVDGLAYGAYCDICAAYGIERHKRH